MVLEIACEAEHERVGPPAGELEQLSKNADLSDLAGGAWCPGAVQPAAAPIQGQEPWASKSSVSGHPFTLSKDFLQVPFGTVSLPFSPRREEGSGSLDVRT